MRKRKNIRLISFLLILSFLIPSGVLANEMGDKEAIICTGEDLTIEERAKVLEFFELENLSEIKLSRTNVNKRQIIKKTTKIMKERDLKLGFFENIKVFFMELFSKVN